MNFCTFAGREFDPRAIKADDIELVDIIRSLAMQPRFLGHTTHHYSVAEHSLNVARLVGLNADDPDDDIVLAALLHDASEAYLGDCPTPLKRHLEVYRDIEAHVSNVIADKFDAPYPWPRVVVEADARLLVTEARDYCAVQWPVAATCESLETTPLDYRLSTPLTTREAMRQFAYAFEDLIPDAELAVRAIEEETQ